MDEGYTICDGLQHYCSDECLEKEITKGEYKWLYEEGYAFWTTFEDQVGEIMNDILRELVDYCDERNYIIENLNMNAYVAKIRTCDNRYVTLRWDNRNSEWYWD